MPSTFAVPPGHLCAFGDLVQLVEDFLRKTQFAGDVAGSGQVGL